MSPVPLRVHLLGSFRLLRDDHSIAGFEQTRLRDLLAYLVLFRTTPISRQQLAFTFWPDTADRQALKNLRTLLTRLRQALPDADEFIHATPQTLQWRAGASFTLDVADFEAALAQAAEAQARGDAARAASAWLAAVAVYAGDLLPDCYEDWILPWRERLRLAYGDALERLALSQEEQRNYSAATVHAQHLLQHDPLSETAYRHLMRLYLAQGNRTEALRTYRACQAMLRREFGAEPAPSTRALYETMRRGEQALPALAGDHAAEQPAPLPLIGRQAEWLQLVAAWRAAAAGKPQMMLVTGEAGIGKTRLTEELLAWAARQGGTTAAARCYPEASGSALAYAAVAEWLRSPSLQPHLAALEDALLVEVARLHPLLLNRHPHLAPPGPLTEPWQRTRLFTALAHAVLSPARAAATPLLLFIDDLHWADRETLDWLLYLLHFDPGAPMLIVGTVREYEIGRDHPFTAFRLALLRAGLLREVLLTPLNETDTGLLAASVAGKALDASTAAQIYRDTEGNPLFVVEMVRAGVVDEETGGQVDKEMGRQVDKGAGRQVDKEGGRQVDKGASRQVDKEMGRQGGYGLGSLSSPALSTAYVSAPPSLPPKVQSVIRWRLAMLSPDARSLAQTAAVIGRKFSLGVLVRSSDQDEATVLRTLDELWRRQIIRAQGGADYDFCHDAFRAVVYDEIGVIRRRSVHLRVAQALEALLSNELDAASGQIAAHYEQAGEPRSAIAFYRRAAAAARHIYANAEAVRLYRHLLESPLQGSLSAQERCAVLLELGEVWQATGYWVKAQAVNQQALDAAERLGDVHLQAQARRALAEALYLQGYYDEALEQLDKAEQGFQTIGEWRGVVSSLGTAGQIYWFRGDHQRARAALEQQHQIAAEIGDRRGMCEALELLGMVQASLGAWEQSADSCLRAIAMAEALELKPVITRAAITLGNVQLAQMAASEAVGWFLRAGELARQIDDRQAYSWAISNIAMVLAKRGDYRRALTAYRRSLRNAWEIGDRWTACRIIAALATVYERQGEIEQAERLYRKAIDLEWWLGTPGFLAGILASLARLLLEQGRAAEAQVFYRRASGMIASTSGEAAAKEDMRFDLRVLEIRLRHALDEMTAADARAALRNLATGAITPLQQAAVQYELWRLAQDDEATRANAAQLYGGLYRETGAEDYRARYRELTGATLPDPAPLPDVSELIPPEPMDDAALDLEAVLADLQISFE